MPYQATKEKLRIKENEYCKLMKKSYEIALKCRETSDKINNKALLLKDEIEGLKERLSSN
ncbi:MAG: hypothetical protein WBG46_06445 [Nonlabens sp.]